MNDHIKILFKYTNLVCYSEWYSDFLKMQDGLNIDVEHLRKVYIERKDVFLPLVQELALRGAKFNLEVPNNLFPNIQIYDDSKYLYIIENKDLYKVINFEKFKMGNLVEKYNIKSDLFFNLIPIDGFKVFNSSVSIKELSSELIMLGFCLKSFEELEKDLILLEKDDNKSIDKEKEMVCNENYSDEIDYDSLNKFGDVLIEVAFNENGFSNFRGFANHFGITLLREINNKVIDKYALFRSVGTKRVENVKKRIVDIINYEYSLEPKDRLTDNENKIVINVSKEYDIEISKLFHQNKLKSFVEYCNTNNIIMISEITDEILFETSKLSGFGRLKLDLIKEILNDYIWTVNKNNEFDENELIEISDKWYMYLKDFELGKVAEVLGLEWNSNNLLKLVDIQGKRLSQLDNIENKKDINKLVKKINLTLTVEEIFNYIMELTDKKMSISQRELECIDYKINQGLTLEKIGENIGVTRERARQLIKKGLIKIKKLLVLKDIKTSMRMTYLNRNFCYIEEVFDISGQSNLILVKALLKSEEIDIFPKHDALGIICFNDLMNLQVIDDFVHALPDTFKFYDYLDSIIDMLSSLEIENIEIENIERLLTKGGFNDYGDYYSRNRMNFLEAFDIILKEYITDPIYIDDEGYKKIVEVCKKHLDFEFESSARAVDARIRDNENLLLVDARTYQHIENLNFNKQSIPIIEEKLDIELKVQPVISAQALMTKYGDEFIKYGVSNKYILYSIVSKFLDKYIVGRGNTLDITMNVENLSYTREDSLLELLDKSNGKVKISELIKLTSWPQYKINDTISKSNQVIKSGEYLVTVNNLGLDDNIKEIIKTIVLREVNVDRFTTSHKLFNNFVIIPDMYDFLYKNDLLKADRIAQIIKLVIPELKGNTYLLYMEDSNFRRFEDVIRYKFTDLCTVEEIGEFLDTYGFERMTRTSFMNNMISSGNFMKISADEFIPINKFVIDNSVIESLIEFIELNFGEKEYLSLKKLVGLRKLPSIDYSWNAYLIESILINRGYKRIERTFFDQGTERLVLVRQNSPINKFDELIYWILDSEYTGNMHELRIYEFLVELGVIYNNEKVVDKKLPFDLYKSEKFSIDEYGRVELL